MQNPYRITLAVDSCNQFFSQPILHFSNSSASWWKGHMTITWPCDLTGAICQVSNQFTSPDMTCPHSANWLPIMRLMRCYCRLLETFPRRYNDLITFLLFPIRRLIRPLFEYNSLVTSYKNTPDTALQLRCRCSVQHFSPCFTHCEELGVVCRVLKSKLLQILFLRWRTSGIGGLHPNSKSTVHINSP